MTTIEITPQLKTTMLKHLVAGRDLDTVATITRIPRERVLDIVSAHGYPDHDKMTWAIDILTKDGDKIPERPVANSHRAGVPLDEPAAPANAQSTVHKPRGFAVIPPSTARPVHTSTNELLHQAGESAHARTRGLAAKISTLLADLTARLAEEQQAHEVKVQAEKENAQVAARIAQLEAEIAKLKNKRIKPAKAAGQIPSTTGQIPRSYTIERDEFPCTTPGCDRTFTTSQGVHLHQRRAHEGMTTRAAGAA